VGGDGLTAAQRRFLAVFVAGSPERRRVVWTREGQVIAPASDLENPPPSATGLRAYRLSDGGYTFVGAAEGRCSLPLREVAGLAPFWRVPLVELNSEGIAAAIAPAPPVPVVRSFKLPPAVDRQLDVRARAEGLTASDVLRELVDKYLRGET
jgi:hypothetical protein